VLWHTPQVRPEVRVACCAWHIGGEYKEYNASLVLEAISGGHFESPFREVISRCHFWRSFREIISANHFGVLEARFLYYLRVSKVTFRTSWPSSTITTCSTTTCGTTADTTTNCSTTTRTITTCSITTYDTTAYSTPGTTHGRGKILYG
jgi:hypothetical protein